MLIRRLGPGDLFGEVGLLTNLKRTATVVTQESTITQVLTKDAIQQIENEHPSIFSSIYDGMNKYQDENLTQAFLFVSNVPLLRGLDQDILRRVTYLMKEHVFDYGQLILPSYVSAKSILILWEGQIQIRVQRKDPFTRKC